MKKKILIAATIVTVAAFVVYSQIKPPPFAPAEDFPREAFIYVQIADLPALIKLWNESAFKSKYLESGNFKDFQNNHLGRKLASRRQEFGDAAGFPIDSEAVSGLAVNQAALAIYDVGKLEFVFIAPVSDALFAATKFAQNKNKCTEATLADGTIINRVKVEADRGRQPQELIFAQAKGRFILATSEKLFVQTLANINGKREKNRLIGAPAFALLSKEIAPHTATVWLDQKTLNDDYYFKRYWLMSDVKDLKNMRAGIFDFEMQDGKFIERRKFLLDEAARVSPLDDAQTAPMLSFVPPDTPFYRLRSASAEAVDEAIEKIVCRRKTSKEASRNSSAYLSFDEDNYYSSGDYEDLGEKYDEAVDETDDEASDETGGRRESEIDFSNLLQTGKPQAVLTFAQPKILPAPLSVEFKRTAIFDLAAPETFDRAAFESAIASKLAAQTLIAAPSVKLNWQTKSEGDNTWRELNLPMLGWSVSYAMRDEKLILNDDADLLRQFSNAPSFSVEKENPPLHSLTVINFAGRENAFDKVFDELQRKQAADDFFTGNIGSLLDSISDVANIEIKEFYSPHTFDEEITVKFKL